MAQISLREYDVKQMFGAHSKASYSWIQLRSIEDISKLDDNISYAIKPDMLFWKRWKRWLLWVNLSKSECALWLETHLWKAENIDGVDGTLDVFLAEPIVNIEKEYYLSFSQTRDGDIITFSPEGWVDIEENWDKTKNITIPVNAELKNEGITSFLEGEGEIGPLVIQLFSFYRTHGFTSLEFNPIAQDKNGSFHLIDAVAKVDDCENYLQKNNWKNIEIPNNYGFSENAGERYIRELDSQTGASLKLKILNPNAKIWTLFAWGGGSLVMTDSLGALGYADEIGNYGECSWNPSREFTREYTKTLLGEMLANGEVWKYLIIAGAIANFTNVANTFQGVIDALEEKQNELRKQQIQILVRRWWINEKKWLQILEDACKKLWIPAKITGSDAYMTDILKEIKL